MASIYWNMKDAPTAGLEEGSPLAEWYNKYSVPIPGIDGTILADYPSVRTLFILLDTFDLDTFVVIIVRRSSFIVLQTPLPPAPAPLAHSPTRPPAHSRKQGGFIVLAGDLGFSVTIFTCCSMACILTLALRRK